MLCEGNCTGKVEFFNFGTDRRCEKIVGIQFLLSDLNLMYERKLFLNSYVSVVYKL